MTMHPALAAWLTETVTLEHASGQDGYGQSTYSAAVTVPARVQVRTEHLWTRQGQEIVSTTIVFLDADVVIGHRDRLTLPDGTRPTIQRVVPIRDHRGVLQHWEVLL